MSNVNSFERLKLTEFIEILRVELMIWQNFSDLGKPKLNFHETLRNRGNHENIRRDTFRDCGNHENICKDAFHSQRKSKPELHHNFIAL
jgi:hypothetical protein